MHVRSFVKLKSSRNGKTPLLFTTMGSHTCYIANMSFKAIREIEILAKISEFTVAYSKTCLKRPLENRQNKALNGRW